ncbi:Uncharacterised protein [Mycobacteroides abscessus subsp. abscessus]|nr:Uncharacterised protein [Mycobacteroides abscessus subsp. abscessus]SKM53529.1 Uncharacterised protein [Mycobacteroides abscessus subsp. abscessus]SLK34893.1 Uncharacterised protein [Mycobacteroides abscessus subsp. abscessus]
MRALDRILSQTVTKPLCNQGLPGIGEDGYR